MCISLPCLFFDFPLTCSSFTVAPHEPTTENGQGHYSGMVWNIGCKDNSLKVTSAFLHIMVRSSLVGSSLNFFTLVFRPLLAQWGQYLGKINMSSVHICPMNLMSIQIKIGTKTHQVYLGGFNGSNRRSPSPSAIPTTLLWLREPLQKRSEIFASCTYYQSVNSDGLELHYSVDSEELDVKLTVPSRWKIQDLLYNFANTNLC